MKNGRGHGKRMEWWHKILRDKEEMKPPKIVSSISASPPASTYSADLIGCSFNQRMV
jgi:hypothetical protein